MYVDDLPLLTSIPTAHNDGALRTLTAQVQNPGGTRLVKVFRLGQSGTISIGVINGGTDSFYIGSAEVLY